MFHWKISSLSCSYSYALDLVSLSVSQSLSLSFVYTYTYLHMPSIFLSVSRPLWGQRRQTGHQHESRLLSHISYHPGLGILNTGTVGVGVEVEVELKKEIIVENKRLIKPRCSWLRSFRHRCFRLRTYFTVLPLDRQSIDIPHVGRFEKLSVFKPFTFSGIFARILRELALTRSIRSEHGFPFVPFEHFLLSQVTVYTHNKRWNSYLWTTCTTHMSLTSIWL